MLSIATDKTSYFQAFENDSQELGWALNRYNSTQYVVSLFLSTLPVQQAFGASGCLSKLSIIL